MSQMMGSFQAVGFQFTVEVLKTLVNEITRVASFDDGKKIYKKKSSVMAADGKSRSEVNL